LFPGFARFVATLALFLVLTVSGAPAQKKKPEKKVPPRVTLVHPLGAKPGATTRVTIRGLQLDAATEIRFPESRASAKIVSKGKAPVPDKNPEKVGDTQIVAEVTLPEKIPSGTVSFVVVTPAGETAPHPLLVENSLPVVSEKEPNDGFRQAQAIQVPQLVEGIIDRAKDVDVFRFEGKAGQKLIFEVQAARYGSPLDAILTLYDANAQQVASKDADLGTDPILEVTLPKTGTFYLSLIDAHDQGGPLHVYRLTVRVGK
jgi:hypothetical protein